MVRQLFTLLCCLCCSFISATGIYNVRDFGAKGDGKTLDSPAINAAIDAPTEPGIEQIVKK